MKVYCTNESIENVPEGYDEKLDITNKSVFISSDVT